MGSTYNVEENRYGKDAPLVDLDELPGWIVQEDEDLLVINKPGWLVCHPSKNGPLSSLVGACREYTGLDRLHLISRLDRETSGIIVLAKRPALARELQTAVEKQHSHKLYLAVLRGEMTKPQKVDALLGRDTQSIVHVKQAVRKDGIGKSAQSYFQPIHAENSYTLALVQILTGRKHQIRAHAHHIGHMVAGDKIYGPDDILYLDFIDEGWTDRHEEMLEMKRQALHAWKLSIECPSGLFEFTAPVPPDIQQLCVEKFGHFPSLPESLSIL
jgi:23S rRNA pseudouridine1911/1915/1917 synthase